jgi:hypothetical protein
MGKRGMREEGRGKMEDGRGMGGQMATPIRPNVEKVTHYGKNVMENMGFCDFDFHRPHLESSLCKK